MDDQWELQQNLVKTDRLLKVKIQKISMKELGLVSNQFGFNWKKLFKQLGTNTFSLKLINESYDVLGLLHLINIRGMLIMNLVEVSKNNLGSKKRYAKF